MIFIEIYSLFSRHTHTQNKTSQKYKKTYSCAKLHAINSENGSIYVYEYASDKNIESISDYHISIMLLNQPNS